MVPRWLAAGHTVFVYARCRPDKETPTVSRLRALGVCVEVVDTRGRPWVEPRARQVLDLLRRYRADVLLFDLDEADISVARACKADGVPTFLTLHGPTHLRHPLAKLILSDPEWAATSVVAVSREIAMSVREQVAARRTMSSVHYLPVGAPASDVIAAWCGRPFEMLYLGWLEAKQKRIIETAGAMRLAASEIEGVIGKLYGQGSNRGDVERALAGQGAVCLGGLVDVDGISDRLRRAQALVLLSDYEGTPTVVMEAMACGVVPVVTDFGGAAREIVEDGETGLIVADRGDAFVDAIRDLATDRALWERLSANAREHARRTFSSDTIAAAWLDLLEGAMGEVNPSPGRPASELARCPVTPTADWRPRSRTLAAARLAYARRPWRS